MDSDNLVALGCPICIYFRDREKPEYLEKNLKAQEISTMGTQITWNTTPDFISQWWEVYAQCSQLLLLTAAS